MSYWVKGKGDNVVAEKQVVQKETVADVEKYPVANLPDRGIRKDVYEYFGVKMAVSEQDGKTPTAVYFPYFNQKGKITGYKKRDLTLDKDDKFHFTTVGSVKETCKLFGQQQAESIQQKKNKVFFVEGEFDVLSVYQACVDAVSTNEKFKHLKPSVVGLSLGCGNAGSVTAHNIEFLESYNNVVLGFDNDEATPQEYAKGVRRGKEATSAVASLLAGNVEILLAEYAEGSKDPNDMLVAGQSKELSNALTFATKRYVAEKVVLSSELSFDDLMAPRVPGVNLDWCPEFMEKTGGPRKGELWIVTGPSGFGKSTICSAIAYSLAIESNRVAYIALEETKKETAQRMLSARVGINYNTYKHNPMACGVPIEEQREAFAWLQENDRFVFLDHFGSLPIEELISKLKYLLHALKVDFVILDHLSMMVSGIETTDERKLLDVTMTELAAFCASHDMGIIAVSHLNRGVAQEFKAPKGEEDKPFWVAVRKEDLRGSAALEQLSWVIVGVEPEIEPDRTRGRVRLVVLKNRPWGSLGECDVLRMDKHTGKIVPA